MRPWKKRGSTCPNHRRLPGCPGRVGLVDHHDHRPHGPQHIEDLLQVALGLAHVLGPEVAELDARDAHRPGKALGQVCLTRADRAANQVTHRRRVETALDEQGRVVDQPLFHSVVAHEVGERIGGLDELDQAPRLLLDRAFLEPLEGLGIELLARLAGSAPAAARC